jgi:hypothetical protein
MDMAAGASPRLRIAGPLESAAAEVAGVSDCAIAEIAAARNANALIGFKPTSQGKSLFLEARLALREPPERDRHARRCRARLQLKV